MKEYIKIRITTQRLERVVSFTEFLFQEGVVFSKKDVNRLDLIIEKIDEIVKEKKRKNIERYRSLNNRLKKIRQDRFFNQEVKK
jgi:hypothetical protein